MDSKQTKTMNNIVDQVKCLSISSPSKDLEMLNLIEENVTEDPMKHGIRKSHTMEVNGKTLELFCSDNPPQTPLEHQVRGVVFSGSKMILQGFPYSNEQIITEKSTEEEISFLYKNNDWTITEAIEGTLIRIFISMISGLLQLIENLMHLKVNGEVKNHLETFLKKLL